MSATARPAHTPGPWFVFGNGHCVGGPADRPSDQPQTAGVAMCGMAVRSAEEAAANALLIAHAPALVQRIESSTRTCTVLAEAMVQLLVACKLNGQHDLQAFLEQSIQLLNATGQANDLALAQAVR